MRPHELRHEFLENILAASADGEKGALKPSQIGAGIVLARAA